MQKVYYLIRLQSNDNNILHIDSYLFIQRKEFNTQELMGIIFLGD